MELNALTAISPLDGRYHGKTKELSDWFSEYALIRYRLRVEVEYFIALCELPLPELTGVNKLSYPLLRSVYSHFLLSDAEKVKETERVTNHDMKAVEYFLKDKLEEFGLGDFKEFVHFGLTSQDVNNTALPLLVHDALHNLYLPVLEELACKMQEMGQQWMKVPMLSRTHGQPASPTTLGKELLVFWERLQRQIDGLKGLGFYGKFGGAVGNFNAHYVAYPSVDWHGFGESFLADKLGLKRQRYTTQISHYDDLSALFDNLRRAHVVLLDLCKDVWTYVSMDYFGQEVKKGEIGSSTMPHKVNPIDFENAEGNLGIANSLLGHFSEKLPISRLQRDLTDSTVTRNIGVAFGHGLIALRSMLKGLNKLFLNEERLHVDLDAHWEVVAEAIQTILRREMYPEPYESLKELTRKSANISKESIHEFVDCLEVSEGVKEELRRITPFNYIGKHGGHRE